MSEHQIEVEMPAPAVDVVALFAARPASWIRAFLVLAARGHVVRSRVAHPPWYRVGRMVGDGSGSYEASLIWWPHLGDRIFSCFRGTFRLVIGDGRVEFGLSGTAVGGAEQNNQSVLAALVDLLVAAISAASTTDP